MEYLHMDILTHLREGFVEICQDHFHEVSWKLKKSSDKLFRIGRRLSDSVNIRSRRLLYSRPSEDLIVYQAKVLCRDYVYVKLKEKKLVTKDIYDEKGGRKLSSQLDLLKKKLSRVEDQNEANASIGYDPGPGPADVSKELIAVAAEFEKCFPYLYEDMADQLNLNFQSSSNITSVFNSVALELFRKGITWARVVSLFTFTGALIVECVQQGQQSYANVVVEALQKFVRRRLASWIIDQGGWIGLVIHFRQKRSSLTLLRVLSVAGLLLGIIFVMVLPS